jgi:hypothetical protein
MEPLRAATAAETEQVAAGPQQAATVMTATTAEAVAAPSTSPAPAGIPRVEVVEVPDDDVSPPGWD